MSQQLTENEDGFKASERLARFFQKLLGEALHGAATEVRFIADAGSLRMAFVRGGEELRSGGVEADLSVLAEWFFERRPCSADASSELPSSGHVHFEVMCRAGNQILQGIAEGDLPNNLRLHDLRVSSFDTALQIADVSDFNRPAFEHAIQAQSGAVVVAAPRESDLDGALRMVMSLTGHSYFGSVEKLLAEPAIGRAALRPFIVSCAGSDAAQVLLEIWRRDRQCAAHDVIGVLCIGFVPRICETCACPDENAAAFIAELPAQLRLTSSVNIRRGAGCDRCGQSGGLGVVGIQCALNVGEGLRELLRTSELSIESMLDRVYPRFVRPMFQDGLHKVFSGAIALRELRHLSPALPAEYQKFLKRGGDAEETATSGVYRRPVGETERMPQAVRPQPLVLVAEDDPDQRSILDLMLRSAGYETVLAHDGMEALERLKKITPDLIITDLMMPNLDGGGLVARIKGDPRLRKIPVMVLTVVNDADKEYALLNMGADDYCEKTIQRKLLLQRVEALLARPREKLPTQVKT